MSWMQFYMHPVHGSDPRMTPFCASEIKALRKCHETSGIMKYFNACNDDKITLNRCLSRDKQLRYEANFKKSIKYLRNKSYYDDMFRKRQEENPYKLWKP